MSNPEPLPSIDGMESTSSAPSAVVNVDSTRRQRRMMLSKSTAKRPDGSSTPTTGATTSVLSASEARKFVSIGIDKDLQHRGQVLVKDMHDLTLYLNAHGTAISKEGVDARLRSVEEGLTGLRAAMDVREEYRRHGG